ncbi:MAG: phosphopantetheine-binding protein [Burkholderiales bacterium]
MTRQEEILAVVRQFVDDLGQDPARIVPEAKLRELGIDSLHAVDLVFRFEEKFEIDIPMENFSATTVGEAIAFMERQIDSAASAPRQGGAA